MTQLKVSSDRTSNKPDSMLMWSAKHSLACVYEHPWSVQCLRLYLYNIMSLGSGGSGKKALLHRTHGVFISLRYFRKDFQDRVQ